jgi:two-component sensor histidine kinase
MTRIDAVSTLHEYLYKTDAGSNVDLGVYLEKIVDYLRETAPANVEMEFTPASIIVGSQQAVSVGTLVNEFVANSFKHAFPDQRKGTVEIALGRTASGRGFRHLFRQWHRHDAGHSQPVRWSGHEDRRNRLHGAKVRA